MGARSTGIDISETMLVEARRRFPSIRFERGDAEALPFEAEMFRSVGCNFGMLHIGRPEKALSEMFRVLQPGGRLAFTVWATPERTEAYEILLDAVNRYGRQDVGLPPGPPFFRFAEEDQSLGALTAVGFCEARVETVEQTWHLPSAESLFDIMLMGTGRTRGLLLAQTEDARAAIAPR